MKSKRMTKAAFAAMTIAALVVSGIGVAEAQYSTTAGAVASAPSLSFLATTGDLSVGSTGERVASLQGLLSELGYLTIPQGVSPGYFGPLTQRALRDYQTALGLSATGMFDASTRVAISNSLANRYPSLASSLGGATGTSNTSGSTGNAPTMSPIAATGYWYNGSWYSAIPGTGTTTPSDLAGYWVNGTWVPIGSSGGGVATSGSTNAAGSGLGYWYNGRWYPATSTAGGGFYSTNPAVASSGSGTGSGYWYNGVWYSTNTANIGGGESSDVSGTAGGGSTTEYYWQNGVLYTSSGVPVGNFGTSQGAIQAAGSGASAGQYWMNGILYNADGTPASNAAGNISYSTNLTPTGYWYNGSWYAVAPTSAQAASMGIPGYWLNNTWQSLDGSRTTVYGEPNPTNPGTGYWMNGVWYSTSQ